MTEDSLPSVDLPVVRPRELSIDCTGASASSGFGRPRWTRRSGCRALGVALGGIPEWRAPALPVHSLPSTLPLAHIQMGRHFRQDSLYSKVW